MFWRCLHAVLPIYFLILLLAPCSSQANELPLQWKPVPQAKNYKLQIATDIGFEQIILEERCGEPHFSWDVENPGIFYWRVIALDAQGKESPPSAAVTVEVLVPAPKPHPPQRMEDTVMSHNRYSRLKLVTLRWNQSTKSAFTLVEISDTLDFQKPRRTISPLSKLHVQLKKPGTYYWRLRALNKRKLPISSYSEPTTLEYIRHVIAHETPTQVPKEKPPRIHESTTAIEDDVQLRRKFADLFFGIGSGILSINQDISTDHPSFRAGSGSGIAMIHLQCGGEIWPFNEEWSLKPILTYTTGNLSFSNTTESGDTRVHLTGASLLGSTEFDFDATLALTLNLGIRYQTTYGLIRLNNSFQQESNEKFFAVQDVGVAYRPLNLPLSAQAEIEFSESLTGFFASWALTPRIELRYLRERTWFGLRYQWDRYQLKTNVALGEGNASTQDAVIKQNEQLFMVLFGISFYGTKN